MTATAPSLMQALGVDKLSWEDKRKLLDELEQNIVLEFPPTVPPDLAAELERRCDEDDANPDTGISWEELLHETRERLKKCRGE